MSGAVASEDLSSLCEHEHVCYLPLKTNRCMMAAVRSDWFKWPEGVQKHQWKNIIFFRIGGNMITCVCKAEVIPGEEIEICKRNEEEKSFLLIGKIIL